MKKEEVQEVNKSSKTIELFGDFVDSFYKMFKIGIYYPLGHVVLDQAASKCLQQLREISQNPTSVEITVSKDKIFLQQIEISENQPLSLQKLHELLYQIGLKSIEIYRNISHKELLGLVKNLLTWRSKVEATKESISFDLEELPATVKLVQQEFTVDAAAQSSTDGSQEDYHNLVQLCEALEQQGLSKAQVAQCRGLLESISQKTSNEKMEISGFPNATWADVHKLLFEIITNSYDPAQKKFSPLVQDDINVISSIFNSLERGLGDKKSKEVLQLLVSHLKARPQEDDTAGETEKAADQKKKPKLQKRKSEGIDSFSIEMLETYIYENSVPLQVLKQISVSDNSERLSIYLQLIKEEPQNDFREKIEAELLTMLTANLTPREIEIVVAGVMSLAESIDIADFCRMIAAILETLRDQENFNSLDFLVNLWKKSLPQMHLMLWPFVINELLMIGMSLKKQSFYDATEIACQMPRDGMYHLRPQIEEMSAFKNKEVAETVFEPAFVYSYPLFAFLLQTSLRDVLSIKIHEALIEQPQDPYIDAIAPILNVSVPAHLAFLRMYMEKAHLEAMPLSVKLEAGAIILEYLQSLSDAERDQPWLAKSISSTVVLCVEGTKQFLQKIVQEKKMGILHKWPKDCRKAAAKALQNMGNQSQLISGKL